MEFTKELFYDFMIDFSEIEMKMSNLLVVLDILEEFYNIDDKREVYSVVSVISDQGKILHKEIVQVLVKVDTIECGLKKRRIRLRHIR